jgi:uncharacterized protein (DUF1697 family)
VGVVVAMLRSINVGGRNRVAMPDLRALVTGLGFGDVATYVQSGNVVFTGAGTPGAAARAVEERIAADLGLEIPVIARTADQLLDLVDSNPLADADEDPTRLHVTFLSAPPDQRKVAALAALEGRFGADRFEVVGQDVVLHCPGGYGETKLNNAYFERRLGVTATTRNWRTVCTLADMAGTAGTAGTGDQPA